MIIQCNSCQKSFIVPDSAITDKGRLVQCNICGSKWTQYPAIKKAPTKIVKQVLVSVPATKDRSSESIEIPLKKKKAKPKKKTALNPYSKEYLIKKHGVKLINPSDGLGINNKEFINNQNTFGFYSYIIIIIVTFITLFGILNLTNDMIIYKYPFFEIYIEGLFETLNSFKLIVSDIISK